MKLSEVAVISYYFTFGSNTNLAKNFVKLSYAHLSTKEAFLRARQDMIAANGLRWAFQYSEKEFAGQEERFGLTEVAIGTECIKFSGE